MKINSVGPIIFGADIAKRCSFRLRPCPEALEEFANRSVVEAPLALLDVEVEVMPRDPIVAPEMALGLVPEVFDAIDVAAIRSGELLLVINAHVMEFGHIEAVVGVVAIGKDDAVGLDVFANDAHQR